MRAVCAHSQPDGAVSSALPSALCSSCSVLHPVRSIVSLARCLPAFLVLHSCPGSSLPSRYGTPARRSFSVQHLYLSSRLLSWSAPPALSPLAPTIRHSVLLPRARSPDTLSSSLVPALPTLCPPPSCPLSRHCPPPSCPLSRHSVHLSRARSPDPPSSLVPALCSDSGHKQEVSASSIPASRSDGGPVSR